MDAHDEFAEKIAEIARRPVQNIGRTCTDLVIHFDEVEAAAQAVIAAGVSVEDAFDALLQVAYARGGRAVAETLRQAIVAGLS